MDGYEVVDGELIKVELSLAERKYRRRDDNEVVGEGVKTVGREMDLSHSMRIVYEIHDWR